MLCKFFSLVPLSYVVEFHEPNKMEGWFPISSLDRDLSCMSAGQPYLFDLTIRQKLAQLQDDSDLLVLGLAPF